LGGLVFPVNKKSPWDFKKNPTGDEFRTYRIFGLKIELALDFL
jgi:hypothetical protein